MFGAGRIASASSRLRGHGLCQQYPYLRPVVATAGARPNDCKASETVSSRAGGDRQQTLLRSRSCAPTAFRKAVDAVIRGQVKHSFPNSWRRPTGAGLRTERVG